MALEKRESRVFKPFTLVSLFYPDPLSYFFDRNYKLHIYYLVTFRSMS